MLKQGYSGKEQFDPFDMRPASQAKPNSLVDSIRIYVTLKKAGDDNIEYKKIILMTQSYFHSLPFTFSFTHSLPPSLSISLLLPLSPFSSLLSSIPSSSLYLPSPPSFPSSLPPSFLSFIHPSIPPPSLPIPDLPN